MLNWKHTPAGSRSCEVYSTVVEFGVTDEKGREIGYELRTLYGVWGKECWESCAQVTRDGKPFGPAFPPTTDHATLEEAKAHLENRIPELEKKAKALAKKRAKMQASKAIARAVGFQAGNEE